ncbi:hypothetical protein Anapl_14268 [Anas platyrhynchos]|uniref:Uncharacterized protein n=1 Tax=Anas platyrhynchos TaxID=8839 RepID=R0LGV7_ANAPL|nr:hypothetical protein Anapl_14268 [Anas platyrhynchos]
MSTAAVTSTSQSSSSSDSTAMPVFVATAFYKISIKMFSAIKIFHSDQLKCDQLKPFISRCSYVSDDNFPRAYFSPRTGRQLRLHPFILSQEKEQLPTEKLPHILIYVKGCLKQHLTHSGGWVIHLLLKNGNTAASLQLAMGAAHSPINTKIKPDVRDLQKRFEDILWLSGT